MPLLKTIEKQDTKIGIWHIQEAEDFFLKQLPEGYLAGHDFKPMSARRRLEILASRYLLFGLIGDARVEIAYRENRKPFLVNQKRSISISHSGEYAAVMTGADSDVSIDIEKIHPRVQRIMDKFLSSREKEWVKNGDDVEKLILFWSAKESLFKLLDGSGVRFKDQLVLEDLHLAAKGSFKGVILRDDVRQSLDIHYEKTNDFVLTYIIN